jgi:hypothetical protein
MLYSASLGPHMKHLSQKWLLPLAFWLTDETYAVVITRYQQADDSPYKHWYHLGSVSRYVSDVVNSPKPVPRPSSSVARKPLEKKDTRPQGLGAAAGVTAVWAATVAAVAAATRRWVPRAALTSRARGFMTQSSSRPFG